MRAFLGALLELAFLLVVAPLLLAAELCALWATDLVGLFVKARRPHDSAPDARQVSVVIPTWNGRHHLEANLASVVEALTPYPGSEIIVVENASDDGSAEYLRRRFPDVVCLSQSENLGFGRGSNAGFRAAKHDIVVLLNNDMRVTPDFLAPLLEPFDNDQKVFAVSAQIFFSDSNKRREETGLTAGRWTQGRLALGHVIDDSVDRPFPSFYAGGGSTAYDRRKFLEIGGFDELLRPFYMEDADVSYLAWKRGWKILYAPASHVVHEHRGTIGKHFSEDDIQRIVHKNNLLFIWKNIHEPGRLLGHFGWTWLALLARFIAGPSPMRPSMRAFLQALRQTPEACRARLRAHALAQIDDAAALRRPLGGYYRDVFADLDPAPKDFNVLFFSPYSMSPPIHGGGVFMSQTVERLTQMCRLHLLCLVDEEAEVASNAEFGKRCASAEIIVRWRDHSHAKGVLRPYAAQHFYHPELEWKLHRSIYLREIDAVQFEYTQLAVYAPRFRRIGSFLFEHDVYFQSVSRGWDGATGAAADFKRFYEYLRALRFERRAVGRFDEVQVCTAVNRTYLESYAWNSAPLYEGLRAGIDVKRYAFKIDGRERDTMLFVGNFKHPPNRAALEWFIESVLPHVKRKRPRARLIAVGAQAPEAFVEALKRTDIEFLGAVDEIREPLARYAVFLAPILSGSGVRVKLLEAFAAGIPVVSTGIGAEGITTKSGAFLELADDAKAFADAVATLLTKPDEAERLARAARREVEANWDMTVITRSLLEHYREVVRYKRERR